MLSVSGGRVSAHPSWEWRSMFRAFVIYLVVGAVAFAITSWLLTGMSVHGGVFSYLWVALLFGLVNATIGTILRIITLPLTLVTLGLFSIIVNAALLEITAGITDDLTIDHFFWTAIWAALILSVVSVILQIILGRFLRKPDSLRGA
jgi:putative membrane protein